MHHAPLLINIAAALVAAFIGGLIARRIGLPTIVGYLVAGMAIGPFTPGFVGDVDTISQLAELGVIFLMLGKFALTLIMGLFFARPARTVLVVAAGLSEIGEFSFIVGQSGVSLGVLSQDQYSLILASALLSITLNPLMFRAIQPVETALKSCLACGPC